MSNDGNLRTKGVGRQLWSFVISHWSLVIGFALSLVPLARADLLTLDTAIRLALERNQALKVSSFTPEIARANVLAEYGRFDPTLTFRRSYSEGETPITTTPLVRSLTQTDDYLLSLSG